MSGRQPDEFQCPQGWPNGEDGLPEGPCGYIGCCSLPGPSQMARDEREFFPCPNSRCRLRYAHSGPCGPTQPTS